METTVERLSQQITELTGAMGQMIERNNNLEREIASLRANPRNNDPLERYKIPDPIKALQVYTGEKNHLNQWLNAAESTLQLFQGVSQQQYKVYFQAVPSDTNFRSMNFIFE